MFVIVCSLLIINRNSVFGAGKKYNLWFRSDTFLPPSLARTFGRFR